MNAVAAQPLTAADPSPYAWVDTAVGGTNRRNRVCRIEAFTYPAGAVDCYATYLQYTDGLPEHAMANHGSVSGYRGVCWTPPNFSRQWPKAPGARQRCCGAGLDGLTEDRRKEMIEVGHHGRSILFSQ